MLTKLLENSWTRRLSYILFYGYNMIYAVAAFYLIIGIFIVLRSEFIETPMYFVIAIIIVIPVPFLSLLMTLKKSIRKNYKKLLLILFGIELPIFGVTIFRIVFIREMTMFFWLLLPGVIVAIFGLVLLLLFQEKWKSSKPFSVGLLLSQLSALIIALYLGLITFFFIPIIVVSIVNTFIIQGGIVDTIVDTLDFILSSRNIFYNIMSLFLYLVVFSTIGGLIITPIVSVIGYFFSFLHIKKHAEHILSKPAVTYIITSFTAIIISLGIIFTIQDHNSSFDTLITRYQNSTDFEERAEIAQSLISRSDDIKKYLSDKYLAQYRYVKDDELSVIRQGYMMQLGFSSEQGQIFQNLFNTIARPFIYAGNFDEDIDMAVETYKLLFDQSIQDGERDIILSVLQNSLTEDPLEASLLDRENESVAVVARTISVDTDSNGIVKTTIQEEFENQTDEVQEVLYTFSLPRDAVVTELLLGPDLDSENVVAQNGSTSPEQSPEQSETPSSPNETSDETSQQEPVQVESLVEDEEIDEGLVAAKGAAQETYDQQIVRRVDPALLEQVGPRQYRLRVYPIPIKEENAGGFEVEQNVSDRNQKVQFSYVYKRDNAEDELPIYHEKRNIYDDTSLITRSFANGNEVNQIIYPATDACTIETVSQVWPEGTVAFLPHTQNAVVSEVYSCEDQTLSLPSLISDTTAILYDISYSTDASDSQRQFVLDAQNTMSQQEGNSFYLFNDVLSDPYPLESVTPEDLLPLDSFGSTKRHQVLHEASLGDYDAIFMVTDDTEQIVGSDVLAQATDKSIYIVHSSDAIPPYSDAFQQYLIRSGAVVFAQNEDPFQYHTLKTRMENELEVTVLDITSAGTWVFDPNGSLSTDQIPETVGESQLLSKFYIQSLLETSNTNDITFFDSINTISQQNNIVSPSSSLIALVTERQKRQLELLEAQGDRYAVEFDVESDLANPSGSFLFNTSAVPEPEEYALMAIAGFLLIYMNREKIRHVLKIYKI